VNQEHKRLLKRFSLGDKEAEGLLVQIYYDTPEEIREKLLVEMGKLSGECAAKLKKVLLEDQDTEDRRCARIKEAIENRIEEELRGKSAGGDDATNGKGRKPE